MRELPEGFTDVLYLRAEIRFSLWDRIKILFGWSLDNTFTVLCEFSPGKTQPEEEYVRINVIRPSWLRRKLRCAEERKTRK